MKTFYRNVDRIPVGMDDGIGEMMEEEFRHHYYGVLDDDKGILHINYEHNVINRLKKHISHYSGERMFCKVEEQEFMEAYNKVLKIVLLEEDVFRLYGSTLDQNSVS